MIREPWWLLKRSVNMCLNFKITLRISQYIIIIWSGVRQNWSPPVIIKWHVHCVLALLKKIKKETNLPSLIMCFYWRKIHLKKYPMELKHTWWRWLPCDKRACFKKLLSRQHMIRPQTVRTETRSRDTSIESRVSLVWFRYHAMLPWWYRSMGSTQINNKIFTKINVYTSLTI